MHLFTNYIQPMTLWLYAHPQLALLFTFIISFAESLAIVGSIIPGSITMTAIGILAGTGVMRIDLTFLAATLGAIVGDSSSYLLGYVLRDRLTQVWPFTRYPHWFQYGKDYFERHGTISIFLGRFFGPMRSIIPLIAGMMRMNHWYFLLANITSAIGWSILYVAPGVLIGIASSELSTESTTRFFAVLLALLIAIWISSLGAKWLLIKMNQTLRIKLHHTWVQLKQNRYFSHLINLLTPQLETNHFYTAAFCFSFILCFFITAISNYCVLTDNNINYINTTVTILMQTIRSSWLHLFFLKTSLLLSPIPLFTLNLSVIFYFCYHRHWRDLRYWLSLTMIPMMVLLAYMNIIDLPNPNALLKYSKPPSFLDINVTLATTWFGFLFFYLGIGNGKIIIRMVQIILFTALILGSISALYLGDAYFTSIIASYALGLTICIGHWICYRIKQSARLTAKRNILLLTLLFIIATLIANQLYYQNLVSTHAIEPPQSLITSQEWWQQKQNLFPLYTTNRFGKPNSILNLQFSGSFIEINQVLEKNKWKKRSNSFFYSLILRAAGKKNSKNGPLVAQFYQNKKPDLIMILSNPQENKQFILQLWLTNYHLLDTKQPILLGSIIAHRSIHTSKKYSLQPITNLKYLKKILPDFQIKPLILSKNSRSKLPKLFINTIFLIKNPCVPNINKPKHCLKNQSSTEVEV